MAAPLDPVDTYSSLVASTQGFSSIAVSAFKSSSSNPAVVTDTWLQGPFGWPPKYSKFTSDSCNAADNMLRTTADVFRVVRVYYETDFSSKVRRPPWDFSSNLPRIPTATSDGGSAPASTTTNTILISDQGDWAPLLYGTVLNAVHGYTPWVEDSVSGFFSSTNSSSKDSDALTFNNLVHDALVCKYDNVMFCGREGSDQVRIRRNVFLCGVLAYVAWLLLAMVLSTIPILGTSLSTLIQGSMFLLVPVTAIHLAYGMAITCFPLVPTCALQDAIETLQVCFLALVHFLFSSCLPVTELVCVCCLFLPFSLSFTEYVCVLRRSCSPSRWFGQTLFNRMLDVSRQRWPSP